MHAFMPTKKIYTLFYSFGKPNISEKATLSGLCVLLQHTSPIQCQLTAFMMSTCYIPGTERSILMLRNLRHSKVQVTFDFNFYVCLHSIISSYISIEFETLPPPPPPPPRTQSRFGEHECTPQNKGPLCTIL